MGNVHVQPCRCQEEQDEYDVDGDVFGNATVFLNIYDLNEEWLQSNHISKDVLNIGGAFHAGVEVHGKEWYFGQEGIECQEPRQHEVHVYRSSIPMGNTCYPEHEVQRFMHKVMSKQWLGGDYDMLERNCCSFAEALCQYLVGRAVPNWVTRFPRMASRARRGVKDLVHAAETLANERLNQKLPCGIDMSEVLLGMNHDIASPMDEYDEEEVNLEEPMPPRLVRSFVATVSNMPPFNESCAASLSAMGGSGRPATLLGAL